MGFWGFGVIMPHLKNYPYFENYVLVLLFFILSTNLGSSDVCLHLQLHLDSLALSCNAIFLYGLYFSLNLVFTLHLVASVPFLYQFVPFVLVLPLSEKVEVQRKSWTGVERVKWLEELIYIDICLDSTAYLYVQRYP